MAAPSISPVLLYVDDNGDDIVLVEIALRQSAIPFQLRQFNDLPAATAYLKGEGPFADRAVHPLPNAVLLDNQLTGSSAADALPELRRIPGCNHLPWIIFSGTLSSAKIAQSYRAGADYFLLKPLDAARLQLILRTLYDSVTADPPCFLPLRSLAEYKGSSMPDAPSPSAPSE